MPKVTIRYTIDVEIEHTAYCTHKGMLEKVVDPAIMEFNGKEWEEDDLTTGKKTAKVVSVRHRRLRERKNK